MPELAFTKGEATGNDFVILDDPEGELDLTPALVRELSDRHTGVGADGVLRVVRSSKLSAGTAALAEEPRAEWFMDYYNADGTIAEMCGNGIRVFAEFLRSKGYEEFADREAVPIGTRAGVRDVVANAAGFQVDLGRWSLDGGEPEVKDSATRVRRVGLGISVGNPHVVVAVEGPNELRRIDLTKAPAVTPRPEHGANVEWVVPAKPLLADGFGQITMRVFERGVGETLSCGTGAAAAALATRYWVGPNAPAQWRVNVPGGQLGVRMFPTEDGEHVGLSGPARLVYSGSINVDAHEQGAAPGARAHTDDAATPPSRERATF